MREGTEEKSRDHFNCMFVIFTVCKWVLEHHFRAVTIHLQTLHSWPWCSSHCGYKGGMVSCKGPGFLWRGPGLTVRDLGSNPPSGMNYLGDPELITISLSSRLSIHKITTLKVLSCFTISIIGQLIRSQVKACPDPGDLYWLLKLLMVMSQCILEKVKTSTIGKAVSSETWTRSCEQYLSQGHITAENKTNDPFFWVIFAFLSMMFPGQHYYCSRWTRRLLRI